MKDRIIAFLDAINLGSSQLAGEIGVQPSGISHILSGRNNPSLDFVLKVLNRYPDLSSEWLLFGRGEMFTDKSLSVEADSDVLNRNAGKSNPPPSEYRSDLFAGVEPRGSADVDENSGGEITVSKITDSDDLAGSKSQSVNSGSKVSGKVPERYNDTGQGGRFPVEADRMILVYSDGTFEQFNLRRDNSKNPVPESDK
jgi:transcriptional regulator with XRE-family HTH domain